MRKHELDYLPAERLFVFKFPALRSLRLPNCGLQGYANNCAGLAAQPR